MKANEAPENIYCGNNGHGNLSYSNLPFPNAVEYCRTDAFIEKAKKWLEEQEEMVGISFQEDFLERFKNYMKGE